MKTLYTTTAVATGDGRNGHVTTIDGLLDTAVRAPKELGGEAGRPTPSSCSPPGTPPASTGR